MSRSEIIVEIREAVLATISYANPEDILALDAAIAAVLARHEAQVRNEVIEEVAKVALKACDDSERYGDGSWDRVEKAILALRGKQ